MGARVSFFQQRKPFKGKTNRKHLEGTAAIKKEDRNSRKDSRTRLQRFLNTLLLKVCKLQERVNTYVERLFHS